MRFGVLGPVLVVDDRGDDITPRSSQQRQVLAALVCAAPSPTSVDTLHELLWPRGAPSANALQALVSKLRRAIGAARITHGPQGYALVLSPDDRIDAVELERSVTAGRASANSGDHDGALRAFADGLGLVRGEPLADLAGAELTRAPAARLAGLVHTARAGHVDALLAAGRTPEAMVELEALVLAEPLDEHWWASLVLAQYRSGRQADALRTFQHARRVLADELGLEPGPELRDAERQVLEQEAIVVPATATPVAPDPGGRAHHHHHRRAGALPARLTSLVGRAELIDDIGRRLAAARLVTLLGPGGAGKTSTALEYARRHAAETAVMVDLTTVGDPDATPVAVAAALGVAAAEVPVRGAAASLQERLVDSLVGADVLLVVDNCEHVVGEIAKLVHQLLETCPELSVLATSREALGVPGEVVLAVPPLPEVEAVELFVERASALAPGLTLGEPDLEAVRRVCERLDGLPLAIELAAARTRTMRPSELLDRLDDRFAVLGVGARTHDPRQQTLRAVVDWSHDLLDDAERAVFRRLAAFTGGATLTGAERVCADDTVPVHQVAGLVERLVDKSLVVVDPHPSGTRFSMLQTLHEYAAGHLVASGEVEHVRDRHAHHMATLVAPARAGLIGPHQREWIHLISLEHENLRVALDVAVARGDADLALRLVAPIGWYFYMVGRPDAGATALEDALSCPGVADPAMRALALGHFGWLAANGPRFELALGATEEAVQLLVGVDDPWVEAFVIATRMMALFYGGDVDDVRRLIPLAEDAATRSGDGWSSAVVALIRGAVALHDGDATAAEASFEQAIEGFRAVGDDFALALSLAEAAEISEAVGEYGRTAALLEQSISISDRLGFSGHPLAMRARLGNLAALQGDLERAEQLHLALLDELGDDSMPWLRAMSFTGLAMVARRMGHNADAESWLQQAWAIPRTRALPLMRTNVLVARAYTADQRGDHELALELALDGLAAVDEHPMLRSLANAFEAVAGALAAGPGTDRHLLAAELLGAADSLRRRSVGPMPAGERFDVDRAEGRCRAQLGDEAFDEAFRRGVGTRPEHLVERVRSLD